MNRRSDAGISFLRIALAVVTAASVLMAYSRAAAADDDRHVDSRTGEKLGKRETLVRDRFRLRKGQSPNLDGRIPDIAPAGAGWVVDLGLWELATEHGSSAVVETSPEDVSVASDKRANIDAGVANVTVAAQIRTDKDPDNIQYSGVTARFDDAVNWIGAWYDPRGWDGNLLGGCPDGIDWCGALVLGAKDSSQTAPGAFIELARYRFDWKNGHRHVLALSVVENAVTVAVDRRVVLERTFEGLGDATRVGIFSRGAGENRFEEFEASGRERFKEPAKHERDARDERGR